MARILRLPFCSGCGNLYNVRRALDCLVFENSNCDRGSNFSSSVGSSVYGLDESWTGYWTAV